MVAQLVWRFLQDSPLLQLSNDPIEFTIPKCLLEQNINTAPEGFRRTWPGRNALPEIFDDNFHSVSGLDGTRL
jgi:hypothetical protein